MAQLNLHHLAVFRAVAQLGNITRAAEELAISQPAVSAQIKALERACRLPLLERGARGVRLTHAGEVVSGYAQRIFATLEELERAVDDLHGLARGRLLLGASTTIGEYLLPEVMGAYQAQYPGVELRLTISNSEQIVASLLRHELDIGFIGAAVDSPDLCVVPYAADEIVLVVSPRHTLARRPSVTVTDLRAAGWIAREPGSATRRQAERCLASAGVTLVPRMELSSNEALKRAVAAGLGFGLVSRHAIATELAVGLLVAPTLTGWSCQRQLWLCYRRDRHLSNAERAFLHLVTSDASLAETSSFGGRPKDLMPHRTGGRIRS
jgi:molybdate transport repressor ModE-like protein